MHNESNVTAIEIAKQFYIIDKLDYKNMLYKALKNEHNDLGKRAFLAPLDIAFLEERLAELSGDTKSFEEYIDSVTDTAIDNVEEFFQHIVYDYMMKSYNIVKSACSELGLTQKELAKEIETSKSTVDRWATSNDMTAQGEKVIQLLVENVTLRKAVDSFKVSLATIMDL